MLWVQRHIRYLTLSYCCIKSSTFTALYTVTNIKHKIFLFLMRNEWLGEIHPYAEDIQKAYVTLKSHTNPKNKGINGIQVEHRIVVVPAFFTGVNLTHK